MISDDIRFMRLALQQARAGIGATSPNPRVGAVLVAEGRVISRGYHRAFGMIHAEVDCLSRLRPEATRGASLYLNLEPCCHFGKTPPCTQALIQAGIRGMVYGLQDPNPQVNGEGLRQLAAAGLEVRGPILEAECRELNRGYVKFRRTDHPWVTLKWAQSLDGRIAAATGDSHWISSSGSLKLAHKLRAESDAVLVGINTALADDPQLTVRHVRGHNPMRVILDSQLRLSPEAALFQDRRAPVLIFTGPSASPEKSAQLREKGAEVIALPTLDEARLDLERVLDELGRRGVLYLLVEGGARVMTSFLRLGLYDEIVTITAPILIGGDGLACLGSLEVTQVKDAVKLAPIRRKSYGPDLATWWRP